MDYVDRLRGQTSFRMNSVLKFTDISPRVQAHLQKVYLTLTGMLLVSAVGVKVTQIVSLGSWLPAIGFIACMFLLLNTQPLQKNLNKRYALLGGCALFQGATLGPLVNAVVASQPGVLIAAFLGTSAVFACFSLAALMSRRRSWLYLGGTLSSALSVFMVLRLGSYFLGGRAFVLQTELYGGLLVFIGYVLFDTQMIVERAESVMTFHDTDHVKHALDLFVDFVAIFVRILVIMLQNAERKEETKSSRRRRQ